MVINHRLFIYYDLVELEEKDIPEDLVSEFKDDLLVESFKGIKKNTFRVSYKKKNGGLMIT